MDPYLYPKGRKIGCGHEAGSSVSSLSRVATELIVLVPGGRRCNSSWASAVVCKGTSRGVPRNRDLTVDGAWVRCGSSPDAVPIETALAALGNRGDDCIAVLAKSDPKWGWRQEPETNGACAYAAPSHATEATDLTSLALLTMLVLARRRRRKS